MGVFRINDNDDDSGDDGNGGGGGDNDDNVDAGALSAAGPVEKTEWRIEQSRSPLHQGCRDLAGQLWLTFPKPALAPCSPGHPEQVQNPPGPLLSPAAARQRQVQDPDQRGRPRGARGRKAGPEYQAANTTGP